MESDRSSYCNAFSYNRRHATVNDSGPIKTWLYPNESHDKMTFSINLTPLTSYVSIQLNTFSKESYLIYAVLKGWNLEDDDLVIIRTSPIDRWKTYYFQINGKQKTIEFFTLADRIGLSNLMVSKELNVTNVECDFSYLNTCPFDWGDSNKTLRLYRPSSDSNAPFATDYSTQTAEGSYLSTSLASPPQTCTSNLMIAPMKDGLTTWIALKYMMASNYSSTKTRDEILFWLITKSRPNVKTLIASSHSGDDPVDNLFRNPFQLESSAIVMNWRQRRAMFTLNETATVRMEWTTRNSFPQLAIDDLILIPAKLDRPLFCSFSIDFCWFEPITNHLNTFLVGRGLLQVPALFNAKYDHLLRFDDEQKFLYVDFTRPLDRQMNSNTDTATIDEGGDLNVQMLSHHFDPPTSGRMCVQLKVASVFSSRFSAGTLQLLLQHYDGQIEQAFMLNDELLTWTDTKITLFTNQRFRFILMASVQEAAHPIMFAIRDFGIQMHECTDDGAHALIGQIDRISCDFNQDLCGWRNQGEVDWVLRPYVDSHLPSDNHEYQTDPNQFKFISVVDKPLQTLNKYRAELRSPTVQAHNVSHNYCLHIAFYPNFVMKNGKIQVRLNGDQLIFESSQSSLNQNWIERQVSFFAPNDFYLLLATQFNNGSVAVNQIQVSHGMCPVHVQRLIDFDCTFELDQCGFRLFLGGDRFNRMPATSIPNAKINDHTLNQEDGHLLGLPLIADHEEAEVSVRLPTLSYDRTACLRFWMNADIPMQVRLRNHNETLFSIDMKKGLYLWFGFEVQLNVPEPDSTLNRTKYFSNLVLTAQYRAHLLGYVAFDDFLGYDGECQGQQCTFTDKECLWQIHHGPMQFIDLHHSETEINTNTGFEVITMKNVAPYHDHSGGSSASKALLHSGITLYSALRSPLYQVDSERDGNEATFCLEVFYFLTFSLKNSVLVLFHSDEIRTAQQVHEQSLNWGFEWKAMQVEIQPFKITTIDTNRVQSESNKDSQRKQFNFYVQLVLPPHFKQTEMYLDDISLVPGRCPYRPNVFACGPGQSDMRIPIDQVCDQRQNCENAADEQLCGQCHFDRMNWNEAIDQLNMAGETRDAELNNNGTYVNSNLLQSRCGYETKIGGSNSWSAITSVETINQIRNDLNIQNDFGWLWVASMHPDADDQQQVQLWSPILRRTYSDCVLKFEIMSIGVRFSVWIMFDDLPKRFELWTSVANSSNNSWPPQFESIHIPIGSIRKSFRLVFLAQSAALSNHAPLRLKSTNTSNQSRVKPLNGDWRILLMKSIEISDCTSKAPKVTQYENIVELKEVMNISMRSGEFKCRNDLMIPSHKFCDLRDDCDDRSDEMNCSYDQYRSNFNSLEIKFHWNGLWRIEGTDERLIDGPTIDRSSSAFIGRFLILRNHLALQDQDVLMDLNPIDPRKKKVTFGKLQGFTLKNREHCSMRFAYQTRAKQPIQMIFAWNSLSSPGRFGRRVVDLSPSISKWELMTMTFDEIEVGHWFSFRIHTRLQADDEYLAIDDISFTTDCYDRHEMQINCLFLLMNGLCSWTAATPIPSPLLASTDSFVYQPLDHNSVQTFQMQPVVRQQFHSRICVQRPSFDSYRTFYAFSFGISAECDQKPSVVAPPNATLVWEKLSNQLLRLSSIAVSLHKEKKIEICLIYAVYGSTFARLRLTESFSQTDLLDVRSSYFASDWVNRCIPIRTKPGNPFALHLDMQLVGPKSWVSLKEIKINQEVEQSFRLPLLCTFDRNASCRWLVDTEHYMSNWIYSYNEPLPVADSTLGTITGSFMYALSNRKDLKRLWIRFPFYESNVCFSFWHTSFVLDRITNRVIDTSESVESVPYELTLNFGTVGKHSEVFRSKAHLNGKWRQAIINSNQAKKGAAHFRAKFLKTPSNPNHVYVLAIDDLEITAKCKFLNCDFGRDSCGWRNSNKMLARQWIQMDFSTCQSEDLRFCGYMMKTTSEVMVADFTTGSVRLKPRAELISCELRSQPNPNACLKFTFAFQSNESVRLSVVTNDQQREEQIWASFTTQQVSGWEIWHQKLIEIRLDSPTGSQELRVRAEVNEQTSFSNMPIVGIRDLHLYPVSCGQLIDTLGDSQFEIILQDSSEMKATDTSSGIIFIITNVKIIINSYHYLKNFMNRYTK